MDSSDGAALHVIDTSGPGGAETLFCQLAEGLDRRPLRSVTVVSRAGWLAERLRSRGMVPELIEARGSINGRYLARLVRLARTSGAKLIHTHLLGSTVYGAIAGLALRLPVIGVFHGPTDLVTPGRLQNAKRWLLNSACSRVVVVSQSTHAALTAFGVNPARITLIRNGVDTTDFSPCESFDLRRELGLSPDDVLVGAVGNIRHPKAYDVLLQAARLVVSRNSSVHFAVIGDGPERDLEALVELRDTLHLRDRFHFLGFRKTTSRLLCDFDVFVSSSRSEGLPLSFLEAMACGVCVVATESGGAQEVITADHTGLLAPIEDPGALAAAIERVVRNTDLRASLGSAGWRKVQREFSLQSTVLAYQELYRDVLTGQGRQAMTRSSDA